MEDAEQNPDPAVRPSDQPMIGPVDESTPLVDADRPPASGADALNAVVDDYGPRDSAIEWASKALVGGQSFDAVSAGLVEQGWNDADALAILEQAREQTRRARGVRTRDDVLIAASQRYRRSLGRVRWLVFLVIVVLAASYYFLSKKFE